jgi:hypothetical protein
MHAVHHFFSEYIRVRTAKTKNSRRRHLSVFDYKVFDKEHEDILEILSALCVSAVKNTLFAVRSFVYSCLIR